MVQSVFRPWSSLMPRRKRYIDAIGRTTRSEQDFKYLPTQEQDALSQEDDCLQPDMDVRVFIAG